LLLVSEIDSFASRDAFRVSFFLSIRGFLSLQSIPSYVSKCHSKDFFDFIAGHLEPSFTVQLWLHLSADLKKKKMYEAADHPAPLSA
jgi:hypothetical protein